MQWYDWLIITVPVIFVLSMAVYTRRYLRDITAFLSAGRVCGRYVISVGDIASGLSIIGLLAYVEVHYKTGFALAFWSKITAPLSVILALYGYCMYRFRETKAQSIGQFLEMRYSRKFRVFAAALRSLAEMLANMIMPALAARFFMYFLDLPKTFHVLGIPIDTFQFIIFIVLVAAISIICLGGSMAIIVTDTIQGFICYPLMVLMSVFILWKFSWSDQIMPTLTARVQGENFLNPYDISKLRDFNYFLVFVTVKNMFLHRASWSGAGSTSSAAKTPHEQKMAALLGMWRNAIHTVLYVLIGVAVLVFLNHSAFAPEAHKTRKELISQVSNDIIADSEARGKIQRTIDEMPVQIFRPGIDAPQSDKSNLDTRYLEKVHESLIEGKDDTERGIGNSLFQKFRTLYYQQMLSATIRSMLPGGLLGLFCLLMILAMISTDDTRIFSATITISQDVILPFIKKPLTPHQHMWLLRWVAIGIGVFFFLGSSYMSQLDYINMYVTLVTTMWTGGCGPVIVFGLYSRFGTTLGAWVSLLTGLGMSVFGQVVQRNWADVICPWLERHDLVSGVDKVLRTLSSPFYPVIDWKMDAVKCPVNSYEWAFITSMVTLGLYILVSYLSLKEPFNLERMLHRGKYSLDGERNITTPWTWSNLYKKLIGITPEYTFWDRVIAWFYFVYSIIYSFLGTFLLVVIWNAVKPWPASWWGNYFLVTFLVIPCILAAITAVWFSICGVIDLRAMFHDLATRTVNHLDNGQVEGNVSLADKAQMEAIDAGKK